MTAVTVISEHLATIHSFILSACGKSQKKSAFIKAPAMKASRSLPHDCNLKESNLSLSKLSVQEFCCGLRVRNRILNP